MYTVTCTQITAFILFLFFLFAAFSVAGYMSFGVGTDSNVLNNLPDSAWYTIGARLMMAVVGRKIEYGCGIQSAQD